MKSIIDCKIKMSLFPHLELHPESISLLKFIQEQDKSDNKTIEESRKYRQELDKYFSYTEQIFNVKRTELLIPSTNVKGKHSNYSLVTVKVSFLVRPLSHKPSV